MESITVLYDGDCGICSWSRDFAEARDQRDLLCFEPFQTADLDALSRGLTLKDAARMAWAIKPDGTRYGGARAVFEVLRRLPGLWRVIGWIGANPLISALLTPPYLLIASQRHRISARLGMNACKLPEPSSEARLRQGSIAAPKRADRAEKRRDGDHQANQYDQRHYALI